MVKYSGDWTYTQAAHLLRRTTYGSKREDVELLVELGLDAAVSLLLEEEPLPEPPVNNEFEEDPYVPIGETWINAPYNQAIRQSNYRNRSLRSWVVKTALENRLNIRDKMVLFWHNHYVVANINDPKFLYHYWNTLTKRATGDFRQLTKEITVDPAMLRYLNGNQNTVNAPNENYARELLELFTVGKGELAGAGDYTTFTETDVAAMAKALTGWNDIGFFNARTGDVYSTFTSNRHDKGIKQLSHRFGNAVIENLEDQEYEMLINVIFQSEHVSQFIATKLYRWFIYYDITDEITETFIVPLAKIIRDNDYQIKPALQAILTSQHFYDPDLTGCMIKHPFEFILSAFKTFEVPFPEDRFQAQRLGLSLFNYAALLQMEIFRHPTVAGWKAFYQAPAYYQVWINSTSLPLRKQIVDILTITGIPIRGTGQRIMIDVFETVDRLPDPYDPDTMIHDLGLIMFSKPITDSQLSSLKEALIPGLPDFEWTVEYGMYRDNPNDTEIKRTVEARLVTLFNVMMTMPEYHLI